MWEIVGFVIYIRSSGNATSKSSNLMDIIKRLDVEQKGVGARAAVLWLTASDTGLQVASGIVTLLFAEGEMGVESQCPSRDRWAYCPVGKKSHNSASASHVCNPSSSDL